MEKQFPNLATRPFTGMIGACYEDFSGCGHALLAAGLSIVPTWAAARFIGCFFGVALLLELLPGKVESGPEVGEKKKIVHNSIPSVWLSAYYIYSTDRVQISSGQDRFFILQ
jgi:hypothetical protein